MYVGSPLTTKPTLKVEVWILIERHCKREVIFLSYMRYEKTRISNQNMATNRPYSARILIILVSLESWHFQLSNDTKIIINRPILMHFMTMF